MYPDYNREARDLIQHFLFKHFKDEENLVTPIEPLKIETDINYLNSILTDDDFKSDYKLLNTEVRKHGVNIPPLVNSYMNLSPTMKMFGGGINHEFSEAEETCIMITFDEIHEEKKERHINSFIKASAAYENAVAVLPKLHERPFSRLRTEPGMINTTDIPKSSPDLPRHFLRLTDPLAEDQYFVRIPKPFHNRET